jgi:hypothetical protein
MIIIAWNGGTPSDIFDAGVFKKVLSIFITAAILKLGQGIGHSHHSHHLPVYIFSISLPNYLVGISVVATCKLYMLILLQFLLL